jgi:hypothetical protein
MTPLVLALALAAPAQSPTFAAVGRGDETVVGTLAALALPTGAQLKTLDGDKTVAGLVSLRRVDVLLPAPPTGSQLVTAAGDRISGTLNGGDAKRLKFRPVAAGDDWPVALDAIAAVWVTAPPAGTPLEPADYPWLAGTPPRDVLLYRNGDAVRGALNGFTETGVKFAPDGNPAREVPLKDLAAVGFNPRFARARKPKGVYALATLADGTRLSVTEPLAKGNAVVAKALCGPDVEIPLSKLVSLDVLQGAATYLSDLTPKKTEVAGFLGDGWRPVSDRSVRGRPLLLLTKDGDAAFNKGLGTHPKTTLTYDLGGKFTRFEALVGLDAATGKRGRASVRVLLDGKDVGPADLKTLTAGAAVPVRLDVRGGKELVLVIDFGPAGDVQADVNWGDARLVE